MFGPRVEQAAFEEGGDRRLFSSRCPAFAGWANLRVDDGLENAQPGSAGGVGIGRGQVHTGELEVEGRALVAVVLRADQTIGFAGIRGLEALALSGEGIEGIEQSGSAALGAVARIHRVGEESRKAYRPTGFLRDGGVGRGCWRGAKMCQSDTFYAQFRTHLPPATELKSLTSRS